MWEDFKGEEGGAMKPGFVGVLTGLGGSVWEVERVADWRSSFKSITSVSVICE